MSIPSLSSDIANRVLGMAKDSPINNAILIQQLIEKELELRDNLMCAEWHRKFERLMVRMDHIQGYSRVANQEKTMNFDTFQMLEANLAEVLKLSTQIMNDFNPKEL